MILSTSVRSYLVLLLTSILVITARSGIAHASQLGGYDASFIKATYAAADHLEKHLVTELNRVMPIVSTGFINLEKPKGSSAFGKLLGEQIASRFSQHGYRVIDLAMPTERPFTKEMNGKPALLRDTKGMSAFCEAQAVIVGDYVVSNDLAYVSVRVLKVPDNSILTSCDFHIRLNEGLKEMANSVVVPPHESLTQKPAKTKALSETQEVPLGKSSEHESLQTKTDKKPKKETVEKPQDGPFATGEITLHPSNRLAAKIIQARLAELGFYSGRIDGIWKKQSRKALQGFKDAQGLKYAFRWDMNTQKALFRGSGQ